MKNLFAFTIVYFAASLSACRDTVEPPNRDLHDLTSYKAIGEEIPIETGMRWLAAYEEKNIASGKKEKKEEYAITPPKLREILHPIHHLVGLAFHHAIDHEGKHHFLVIPIDETLTLWPSSPGKKMLDANSNALIAHAAANQWAAAYRAENPEGIWFHFFGSDVIHEILSLPDLDRIQIEPAISDVDMSPQLLLIVSGKKKKEHPHKKSLTADSFLIVYDASSPCPPCGISRIY